LEVTYHPFVIKTQGLRRRISFLLLSEGSTSYVKYSSHVKTDLSTGSLSL